jgi:DNA adenine methylase
LRTPISYYGGKQRLVPEILPLIPPHVQYIEPFCGGGAVFFAKNPSRNEVLNDYDNRITNFYYQCKTNFHELQKLIQASLHSEILHTETDLILADEGADPVKRAWALWMQCTASFSHIIGGGFAFGENGSGINTANKRDNFTEKYMMRLRSTEIFNRGALEIIELKQSPNSVIFADPPYYNSDMGHYKGYTETDFINLLELLAKTPAKFILTSYPSEQLMKFRDQYGWGSKDIKQIVSVTGKRKETLYKTECITYNFVPPNSQPGLFDEEREKEKEEWKQMIEDEN